MQIVESWRPLFEGRCNGTSVKFICFNTGGYAVVQEERVLFRGDGPDALTTALDQFLSIIERPVPATSPARTATAAAAKGRLKCAG
jgi:hypothetical protein